MIQATRLAMILDQYVTENPNEDPTPQQLANFIVARNFEIELRSDKSDSAPLLRAAVILLDKETKCGEERLTIFDHDGMLRMHGRESQIEVQAPTFSQVLIAYARALAGQ